MVNLVGDSAVTTTPAIKGTNTASGVGVYGINNTGTSHFGPVGVQGDSTHGIGVYGTSSDWICVYGEGGAISVQGQCYAAGSVAVKAIANGTNSVGLSVSSAGGNGISTTSSGGWAVYAYSSAPFNDVSYFLAGRTNQAAVYGSSGGYSGAYGGYFTGAVYVSGWLTKAGGGYMVDHPSDPENKYLNHCFVESPEMMNIYRGRVALDANGSAVVNMPDYFEAANQTFEYGLTAIGAGMPTLHVESEIKNGSFTIGGGIAGKIVSWTVSAARADKWALANHPGVEIEKKVDEKGLFMHPELFGFGKEKSVHAKREV